MTAFAEHLKNHYVPNSVIVDSTASEVPAAHYLEWMQKGLHIITPNKKLNSGPLEQYLALRQFQRESYIHYFYEVCSSSSIRETRKSFQSFPDGAIAESDVRKKHKRSEHEMHLLLF